MPQLHPTKIWGKAWFSCVREFAVLSLTLKFGPSPTLLMHSVSAKSSLRIADQLRYQCTHFHSKWPHSLGVPPPTRTLGAGPAGTLPVAMPCGGTAGGSGPLGD